MWLHADTSKQENSLTYELFLIFQCIAHVLFLLPFDHGKCKSHIPCSFKTKLYTYRLRWIYCLLDIPINI